MTNQIKINTDEFIEKILYNEDTKEFDTETIYHSIVLALKTMFYSKKWTFYYILGIFPLTLTIFSNDKLFGNPNAALAFINSFTNIIFLLLFTFGCLLISLPLSSDEISDNTIDLYLVRPIPRSSIWLSRWIVSNFSIIVVNMLIATTYYLFFHFIDEELGQNLDLLLLSYVFLVFLTLTYSGLFLLVGFIGSSGFTLGIILAIFESFFLSLLFLANNRYIPRTHLENIADWVFGTYYTYEDVPSGLDVYESILYVLIVMISVFLMGLRYMKNKEFN